MLNISSNGSVFFLFVLSYETWEFLSCVPIKIIHAQKLFLHIQNLNLPVVTMNWRSRHMGDGDGREVGGQDRRVPSACSIAAPTGFVQGLKTETKQNPTRLFGSQPGHLLGLGADARPCS